MGGRIDNPDVITERCPTYFYGRVSFRFALFFDTQCGSFSLSEAYFCTAHNTPNGEEAYFPLHKFQEDNNNFTDNVMFNFCENP